MVVVTAPQHADLTAIHRKTGRPKGHLATEREMAALFPDCELGAMPPFGHLYDMEVFVAGSLIRADMISFNAGTHTEILTVPFWEFERLVEPRIGYFTFRRLQEKKSMS